MRHKRCNRDAIAHSKAALRFKSTSVRSWGPLSRRRVRPFLCVYVVSDLLQGVQRPSACAAMTSSSLNLIFSKRFFSLSLFLLLDEP